MLETTEAWEHDGVTAGERRESIGAVDETFLQRMMLVCIDRVSGSLLFAEVAEDRPSVPWHPLVEARLKTVRPEGWSLVRDRAKALITLAETGLGCLSIPEVFPLIHALVKSYALAIAGRLSQAQQALEQAQESLSTCQASSPSGAEVQQAQAGVEGSPTQVQPWGTVDSAYRHHLARVSLLVPPWRLVDSTPQRSAAVERQLHAEIDAMEAWIATQGLPVKKQAVDKVRKPLCGVSALVDLWWEGVRHDVHHMALTPLWTRWVAELLLPLM